MSPTKSPVDVDAHEKAIVEYFALVDRLPGSKKGSAVFEAFLPWHTPDVRVRTGNHPTIEGLSAFEAVLDMPSPVGELRSEHHIVSVVRDGDTTVLEMSVDYTVADGEKVTIPCASVLRFDGDLIRSISIYMDQTPVFSNAKLPGS